MQKKKEKKRDGTDLLQVFFLIYYILGGNLMAFTIFVLVDSSHEISSLIFLIKVTEFKNVCYKFCGSFMS